MKVMFKVIKEVSYINNTNDITSHHNGRYNRIDKYKELLSNEYLYSFIVDTNHKNGLEIHSVNVNGLIYIHNRSTNKLITVLHPRPRQLKRYFINNNGGYEIPTIIKELISTCHKRNEIERLNEV